ncbi:hypothetical protein GCM10007940_17850 [Portibacter lacus]|uniref:T9SS C-terminal target domain-containing protein n=1 Tax=Portibacter lacus TaxID=1099794 RepID=A0AA37SNY0_9BACT|nr:hypothetical protein GCM10007940_17850 [Portibacter lacus]
MLAQDPVLVTDFYEGLEDAFQSDEYSYSSVQVGNKIFLPVTTEETGEEIGIIENNEIKVVKDILEGSESSDIKELTVYNDKVYFAAKDGSGGSGLWETDGTEEGTEMIFKIDGNSNSPIGLIVSKSNVLYYTYAGNLYSYDGTENKKLRNGVNFVSDFATASNLYCLYGDDIAFLEESGPFGDNIQLVILKDGQFKEVGEIVDPAFFSKPFGLNPVSNGLVFVISGDSEESATYKYLDGNFSFSKLKTDGSTAPFDRLENVSDKVSVGLIREKGYYAINGVAGEEYLIRETTEVSTTQGFGFEKANYGDKFIIQLPEGGFFNGSNNIIYSDGTAEGSKVLIEMGEYNSNIVTNNQFAYVAKDISNGFEPVLYEINMDDGSYKLLKEFEERSLNLNSIYILGVVDNNLYYISNLDPQLGRELYYLPLGPPSSISSMKSNQLDVRFEGNGITINSSSAVSASVNIFNLDGKLIQSMDLTTNLRHDISQLKGAFVFQVILDGRIGSYKHIIH